MSVTKAQKQEFTLRWLTSGNVAASGKHIGVGPAAAARMTKNSVITKMRDEYLDRINLAKLDAIRITTLDACLMYGEAYSTAKQQSSPSVMIQATAKLVELYGINPLTQSQIDRNSSQNVDDAKREEVYAVLMKQLADELPD